MLTKPRHAESDSEAEAFLLDIHVLHVHTNTSHANVTLYALCKLPLWFNGCVIPDPTLMSTQARNGNWWIYVSWHALLAQCPSHSVALTHLWFILQMLILFIQCWQPSIIHPSPAFFSLVFLLFLFCLLVSMFHFCPPPDSPRSVVLKRNCSLSSAVLMKGCLFLMLWGFAHLLQAHYNLYQYAWG